MRRQYINKLLKFLLVVIIVIGWPLSRAYGEIKFHNFRKNITHYSPTWQLVTDNKNLQIAIRHYNIGNEEYFLTVNPNTLQTQILPVSNTKILTSLSLQEPSQNLQELKNTSYFKELYQYTSFYPLENAGLKHANHEVQGMFLTIDMCPSKKQFEKHFFQQLIEIGKVKHQPIPVAISLSGYWALRHENEFAWLMKQTNKKQLQITWINHSFSHYYSNKSNLPLDKNFMLHRPRDFVQEVFKTEQLLLANNQTPSIFFRFPGLVADKALILKLRQLGLIPVGSDAWLAKNETPNAGSIILVHGNSNEHTGIIEIEAILNKPHLPLLPLTNAVISEHNN